MLTRTIGRVAATADRFLELVVPKAKAYADECQEESACFDYGYLMVRTCCDRSGVVRCTNWTMRCGPRCC
jgi:hypothetical protein